MREVQAQLLEQVLAKGDRIYPGSDPVRARKDAAMFTGAMAELAQQWLAGKLGDDEDVVVDHAAKPGLGLSPIWLHRSELTNARHGGMHQNRFSAVPRKAECEFIHRTRMLPVLRIPSDSMLWNRTSVPIRRAVHFVDIFGQLSSTADAKRIPDLNPANTGVVSG